VRAWAVVASRRLPDAPDNPVGLRTLRTRYRVAVLGLNRLLERERPTRHDARLLA
jgi:hypothetical protein